MNLRHILHIILDKAAIKILYLCLQFFKIVFEDKKAKIFVEMLYSQLSLKSRELPTFLGIV